MAKRNNNWDSKKLDRWIKEGRGQGEGENYKPWLTIQDFPSMGRVTRVFGWTTQPNSSFFLRYAIEIFLLIGLGGKSD